MPFELACCTQTLLTEITDEHFTEEDVALTYAMAICSSERTNWARVNSAIIDRWGIDGLDTLRRRAWERIKESDHTPFPERKR